MSVKWLTLVSLATFVLISAVASAAEQTVKGKIKSVDATKNSIKLDDLELDVSRKTKITIDGKKATIADLKVGKQANVIYDDSLDVAVSISIGTEQIETESDVGELLTFKGHTGGVWCVAFSPDGKTVVSGQGVIFGIGEAGKPKEFPILLWDAETKKEIRRFNGHKETVRTVAFSPDGQQIVSGSWDKTIRLWDVKTGKQIRSFEGHSGAVTGGITFTADGNRIFSGSVDKTARMWDVKTGKELKSFAAKGEVHCISLSPDNRLLLTGEMQVNDQKGIAVMSLWDIKSGKLIRRFSGLRGGMNSLSFSPDGQRILSAGQDWVMQLWDVETGDELKSFEGHSCCFTPDGKSVFANSKDKCLVLWDLESGKEFRRFDGHDKTVCVAVSSDGRKALSGGFDKTVKVWGLPKLLNQLGQVPASDKAIKATEVLNLEELNSSDGESAPCLSEDGIEIFWWTAPDFSIWVARRPNADALFADKKRLFFGQAPVLSSDGLQMYLRNADAETISFSTRKSRDDEFGRPRPVPSLSFPGQDAAPRWLSHNGLTIYLDMKDKSGRHLTWEAKRDGLNGDWKKPTVVQADFKGMPNDFRFNQVSSTPDDLHLFCMAEFSPTERRIGILSRTEPKEVFTKWTEIPMKNPQGQYPRCSKPQFVSETNELFLASKELFAAPASAEKQSSDIWVIKDFRPPTEK